MRHHNPLRQRGIGPSLTCRVGIGWVRIYDHPCNFPVSAGIVEILSRKLPVAARTKVTQQGVNGLLMRPKLPRKIDYSKLYSKDKVVLVL